MKQLFKDFFKNNLSKEHSIYYKNNWYYAKLTDNKIYIQKGGFDINKIDKKVRDDYNFILAKTEKIFFPIEIKIYDQDDLNKFGESKFLIAKDQIFPLQGWIIGQIKKNEHTYNTLYLYYLHYLDNSNKYSEFIDKILNNITLDSQKFLETTFGTPSDIQVNSIYYKLLNFHDFLKIKITEKFDILFKIVNNLDSLKKDLNITDDFIDAKINTYVTEVITEKITIYKDFMRDILDPRNNYKKPEKLNEIIDDFKNKMISNLKFEKGDFEFEEKNFNQKIDPLNDNDLRKFQLIEYVYQPSLDKYLNHLNTYIAKLKDNVISVESKSLVKLIQGNIDNFEILFEDIYDIKIIEKLFEIKDEISEINQEKFNKTIFSLIRKQIFAIGHPESPVIFDFIFSVNKNIFEGFFEIFGDLDSMEDNDLIRMYIIYQPIFIDFIEISLNKLYFEKLVTFESLHTYFNKDLDLNLDWLKQLKSENKELEESVHRILEDIQQRIDAGAKEEIEPHLNKYAEFFQNYGQLIDKEFIERFKYIIDDIFGSTYKYQSKIDRMNDLIKNITEKFEKMGTNIDEYLIYKINKKIGPEKKNPEIQEFLGKIHFIFTDYMQFVNFINHLQNHEIIDRVNQIYERSKEINEKIHEYKADMEHSTMDIIQHFNKIFEELKNLVSSDPMPEKKDLIDRLKPLQYDIEGRMGMIEAEMMGLNYFNWGIDINHLVNNIIYGRSRGLVEKKEKEWEESKYDEIIKIIKVQKIEQGSYYPYYPYYQGIKIRHERYVYNIADDVMQNIIGEINDVFGMLHVRKIRIYGEQLMEYSTQIKNKIEEKKISEIANLIKFE